MTLPSALESRGSTQLLFSQLDPLAHCVFCGRPRPMELAVTWMCGQCKRKTLYDLIWSIELPACRQERREPA